MCRLVPEGCSQLLRRIVQRFRGGLEIKAHRRVYHSSTGSRVKKKDLLGLADVDVAVGPRGLGRVLPPTPGQRERPEIVLPLMRGRGGVGLVLHGTNKLTVS